jgi:putative oxidoreductase
MLQRLVTAAALVFSGIAHPHPTPAGFVIVQIVEIGAAAFLLVGLWTPVVGAIVAFREMWIVFCGNGDPWLPLVLAALGASLAVIGPGAWSIDARLFGRKHLKTPSR